MWFATSFFLARLLALFKHIVFYNVPKDKGKSMKKMLRCSFFWALALSASALSGCAGGNEGGSSSSVVDLSTLALSTVDKTLVGEKEKLAVTLQGEALSSYKLKVLRDGNEESDAYTAENGTIQYLKTGTYTLKASVPSLGEAQVGEDVTVYPSIEEEIKAIPFENLILGETYSISPHLDSKLADFAYDCSDANSFLEVTSQNTLKVVGVSRGNLKISRKSSGDVVFNDLAIVKSTIVVSQIRDYLYNAGIIASSAAPVSKDNMAQVKSLSFKKTLVDDLDATISIAACPNLESLTITDSNLSDLSFLKGLSNLTSLALNDNAISDISPLGDCRKLSALNLSGNQIADITPLRRLDVISDLNLRDNLITDLGPLSSLASLNKLYLGYNDFSKITDIAGLTNLKDLDLSYSKITFENAVVLDYLKSLEYLDLSGISVDLSLMPSSLPAIKTLKLDNCGINNYTDLVGVLSNYPSLTGLSIAYDEVMDTDLDTILSLKALTSLDLSGNPLTLDESKNTNTFAGMSALLELSFAGCNNIPNLSALSAIKENLTSLNLSGCNSLSDFASIKDFKNLKTLNIRNDFNLLNDDIIATLKAWVGTDLKHPAIAIELLSDGSSLNDFTFYTSLASLKKACTSTSSSAFTYSGDASRLVVSFANESYNSSLENWPNFTLTLPKSVSYVYWAGLPKRSVKGFSLVAADRTADLSFAFENMTLSYFYRNPAITMLGTSTLRLSFYGQNNALIGSFGPGGANGSGTGESGQNGENGYSAIKANGNVRFDVYSPLSLRGGDGGKGGDGISGNFFSVHHGGNGGNGGNGADAVTLNGKFTIVRHVKDYSVTMNGGAGGAGGKHGEYLGADGHDGSSGSNGGSSNVTPEEYFKRSR
jgi:Leucine-rich repeat (LRR) protein